MPENPLVRWGTRVADALGSVREEEYRHVLAYVGEAERILDVGCGTGTLLAKAPERFVGVDLNPENVDFCLSRGLTAQLGDAAVLQFPDESFDAATCSHVMQALSPADAASLVRELGRVVKPGGSVVITNVNWSPEVFRDPQSVRPYPPAALNAYFAHRHGAQSPAYPEMPDLRQTKIWCRRPPLIRLRSARRTLNRVCGIINRVQYKLGLRRWWTYDAYIVRFTKAL